jgi:hypothetical protein
MSALWPDMPRFGDDGYDRSDWLLDTDPVELAREHRELLSDRVWRTEAWTALTRIAADHRFCDCTGSYPCAVRQVVDTFGRDFLQGASDEY